LTIFSYDSQFVSLQEPEVRKKKCITSQYNKFILSWNLKAATVKYRSCYERIWCHCAAEYKLLQLCFKLFVWKTS